MYRNAHLFKYEHCSRTERKFNRWYSNCLKEGFVFMNYFPVILPDLKTGDESNAKCSDIKLNPLKERPYAEIS